MAVQTNEEVLALVEEMMPDLVARIIKKAKGALESGAINLADYENAPYKPAKMLIAAALADLSFKYMPPHPTLADKKELKNISRFI